MQHSQIIAVDAMGGDYGPEATVPGAALAMKQMDGLRFLYFGDEEKIRPVLDGHSDLMRASEIVHTDSYVKSEDKPGMALRTGRKSSMRLAINAVAEGNAQSVVSAGNTGALMAMSKFVLKSQHGVHRPAIASVFPTQKGETIMLDLGANVECSAENLVQFALLGAVVSRVLKGIHQPTVGLVNVGTEDMKGNDQVRKAAAILKKVDFPGEFKGFIEGNDIPLGKVDVVVTDGFTGNVALKLAEGMGTMTGHFIREAFMSSVLSRLGGLLAMPAMKRLKKRFDPRYYNGGMFLGLDGICVKSHGAGDSYAFSRALLVAADLVSQDFSGRVDRELEHLTSQESFISEELNMAES